MLSLLFIICLASSIYCFRRFKKNPDIVLLNAVYIGIVACIIALLLIINCIDIVANEDTIDNDIAMYEEENATIEECIAITTRSHMDFKAMTDEELKDKDFINLLNQKLIEVYVEDSGKSEELKDEDVINLLNQKLMEDYTKNNDQIEELKNDKSNLSFAKWSLYFGK